MYWQSGCLRFFQEIAQILDFPTSACDECGLAVPLKYNFSR